MRRRILALGLFLLLASGCRLAHHALIRQQPVQPTGSSACGTFTIKEERLQADGDGMHMKFTFHYAEGHCQTPRGCQCDKIYFVQMVRTLDTSNNQVKTPFSALRARTVTHDDEEIAGWAIDQFGSYSSPFFGVRNDGSVRSDLTQLGSPANDIPALLDDDPGPLGDNILFEAVSVAVCVDESGCAKLGIAGYKHWGYSRENGVSQLVSKTVTNKHRQAFTEAVKAWNANASSQGKQKIPPLERMPATRP